MSMGLLLSPGASPWSPERLSVGQVRVFELVVVGGVASVICDVGRDRRKNVFHVEDVVVFDFFVRVRDGTPDGHGPAQEDAYLIFSTLIRHTDRPVSQGVLVPVENISQLV